MGLEREVHTRADHPEIVVGTVYEVPAEITDPTDMRRKADFNAAADLAESFRLCSRETLCLDNVEAFPGFSNANIFWALTTTEDSPTASKNVRRKAAARNWITQCQGSQRSTDRIGGAAGVALKNLVAEIDERPLARLSGTRRPSFYSDAEVTHEEVFDVSATAPGVIGLKVAVISQFVPVKM